MSTTRDVCKHPIKSLGFREETWVDNHPYGEDTHKDLYFTCLKCEKKILILTCRISSATYEELTGRELDLEEAKKLFKIAPGVYHYINDMHRDIKKIVQNNPQLEKRIAATKKKINKLQEELKELQIQYNGGVELW